MNEALERLRRVQYIGRQTAKLLYEEKGIEGIEGLLEFSKDELKGISGIGEHKAEEILKSAERLTESLERCDICGFYSERDQECPYCKDKNRSINGRSEDSIVDTFIQSKNGRKFSVEKDKAFYNKMMHGTDKTWAGNETGQSLVDLFIRYNISDKASKN